MTTRSHAGLWVVLGIACTGCASELEPSRVGARAAQLTAAGVELIAIGQLDASGADKSAQTAAALDNGAPGNLLGGIGSGLAHVRGDTYLAVPDRGPNATKYDAALDDTTSYIPRFHTLTLALHESAPGAALPFELAPELRATTLLWSREPLVYGAGDELAGEGAPALNQPRRFYFSGRSDNFDPAQPSTDPGNGRFDPENIRISNDGRHVFIADEYGPYIYQFDRRSGRRERVFSLPADFAVTQLRAAGDTEIADNTQGRVANKGMEGLAITPDGTTLIGAMQSPLLQDGGTDAPYLRIVTVSIASGASAQYAYPLTNIGSEDKPKYPTVSELTAINAHALLVDERDGKGLGDDSEAKYKRIYRVDLCEGSDVSGLQGADALAEHALSKTLIVDLVELLTAHGLDASEIPAKLEGLTFGPDVTLGGARKLSLFVSNDNDFLPEIQDETHPDAVANPNQFFVLAVDPETLPDFEPQVVAGRADGHGLD